MVFSLSNSRFHSSTHPARVLDTIPGGTSFPPPRVSKRHAHCSQIPSFAQSPCQQGGGCVPSSRLTSPLLGCMQDQHDRGLKIRDHEL